MKKIYGLLLIAAFTLTAGACEQEVTHARQNPGQYVQGGKDLVKIVKGTNVTADSTLEKAANITNSAASAVGALSFIPGVNAVAAPLTAGLTALGTLLGWMVVREKKKVTVEKKKADNYRESIEAGIQDGEDKAIVNVSVLKEVLDKETKAHFNEEGQVKL